MEILSYLKAVHEMWKLQCIGKYEIKKFLFYKDLDLITLNSEKIEAKHFTNNSTYTID